MKVGLRRSDLNIQGLLVSPSIKSRHEKLLIINYEKSYSWQFMQLLFVAKWLILVVALLRVNFFLDFLSKLWWISDWEPEDVLHGISCWPDNTKRSSWGKEFLLCATFFRFEASSMVNLEKETYYSCKTHMVCFAINL